MTVRLKDETGNVSVIVPVHRQTDAILEVLWCDREDNQQALRIDNREILFLAN